MTVTQRDERETKVRRFYDDVWSQGDMDAADEILDPGFRFILTFLTIEDRGEVRVHDDVLALMRQIGGVQTAYG